MDTFELSAAAAAINIEQNFGLRNFCHVSKLHHFASPSPNSLPADQPSGGDFLLEKTNRRSTIFGGYPILENRDFPLPLKLTKKTNLIHVLGVSSQQLKRVNEMFCVSLF